VYLNKNSLVSPISGYITKVNVRQGDKVIKGNILFEIQTTEAYIMSKKDPNNNYGVIKIKAPVSGQLVNLNIVNSNIFINIGSELCNILESDDLKLQINVPFEYNKFIKIGRKCMVVLPDNTKTDATFINILPQVDEIMQTEKVLAEININYFLPENIIVKVLIDRSNKKQTQILPETCLQTDALMSKYWVMKLINDTTAVQVYVKKGNILQDSVEILSPLFNDNDMIISEGAYGLSDTVLINIK
jgi:hypothetical protein